MKKILLCILIGMGLAVGGGILWFFSQQEAVVPIDLSSQERERLENRITSLKNATDFSDLVDRGHAYEQLGKYGHARQSYLAATQTRPKAITPWMNVGYLFLKMNNPKAALDAFNKVIEYDSANLTAYLEIIHLKQKTFKAPMYEIAELYKQAAQATNNNVELYRDFARYLDAQHKPQEALEYWQVVRERLVDDEEAKSRLGR